MVKMALKLLNNKNYGLNKVKCDTLENLQMFSVFIDEKRYIAKRLVFNFDVDYGVAELAKCGNMVIYDLYTKQIINAHKAEIKRILESPDKILENTQF